MAAARVDRRTFLAGAAALALSSRQATAQAVPNSAGTEPARIKAPPNACDCHMHIYDSRYPALPNTASRPDALVAHYRLLQTRIGTTRHVIVHPSTTYGLNPRITLDAAAAIGPTARMVAVVDVAVTDVELKRLDALGVRGIRFNLGRASGTTAEMMEPLAKRVATLGWHLQLNVPPEQLLGLEATLLRLPTPLVFDHFGQVPQPDGIKHPAYRLIRTLLDRGRTWVKLSAPYSTSKTGPPYADVTALGKDLVRVAPERLVWASDWPPPTATERPNDALLFDLLAEWAPDEAVRHRILVRNPEVLYGFPPS